MGERSVVERPPAAAAPRGHLVLPAPESKFDGVIGTTYKDSTMGTFPVPRAPDGAPNVLLIVIDDCGFGQWSTFGGQIPTPEERAQVQQKRAAAEQAHH